ncbi:MAG: terpene cyclase/mutase family protein, partial [bacterium]|nr:terpene cyclase/mutase family protein [bacterium]
MAPQRPLSIASKAHTHEEVTFQDLMAEQLRHAPWLFASASAHAIAILLLWVLIPPEAQRSAPKPIEVVDTTRERVEPIVKPEKIKTKPEDPIEDLTLVDIDIPLENDADVPVEIPTDTPQSAFDDDQWNKAVGLGGGATGRGSNHIGDRIGHRAPTAITPRIEASLSWLARHQDADGRWDCDQFMKHDLEKHGALCDGPGNAVHDVGITGLALLAFLGDGHSMRAGRYEDTVRRSVLWLREQQQDNGLFGQTTSQDFIYDHAIAAYAMCEAYGMSQYKLLRNTAQRGLDYLESHRNPYGVWRYQPRGGDDDTSVTGWAIMALESGKHFGLQVNQNALQNSAVWLDRVAGPDGRHGYTKAGELSSRKPGDHASRFPIEKGETMTAVALFCRYFMGQNPRETAVMQAAADRILAKPPVWDEKGGAIDHYYWYSATYALFQMGGRHWTEWQKHLN